MNVLFMDMAKRHLWLRRGGHAKCGSMPPFQVLFSHFHMTPLLNILLIKLNYYLIILYYFLDKANPLAWPLFSWEPAPWLVMSEKMVVLR